MKTNKIRLQIITPNKIFFDDEVEIVTVKTIEGYMGFLYGKSPLITSIDIGELHINYPDHIDFKRCAIANGILYAHFSKIEIITDAIEWWENIDLKRAQKAKKNAEILIKNNQNYSQDYNSELSLKKAINRITVKNKIF